MFWLVLFRLLTGERTLMITANIDPADTHFWNRIARKYASDPIKDMVGYDRTVRETKELLGRSAKVLEQIGRAHV